MRFLSFVLFLFLLPISASAQPFEAINKLKVAPVNASDFEVIGARGEGARGMWCAAADYVIRGTGAGGDGRLYLKTPRGPSVSGAGAIGAVFTTDPGRLNVMPTKSYSVSVRKAGLTLPTEHAYLFCRDYQIELRDILFRIP